MRSVFTIAIALAAIGCKKKHVEPRPDPLLVDAAIATITLDAALELRALPPAKDGVAYAMAPAIRLKPAARLERDSWALVDGLDISDVVEGLDGTPIATGPLGRIVDGKLVPIELPEGVVQPSLVGGAADGVVWALAGGKLWRAPANTLLAVPPPGDDPPHGLAMARDGKVWIHTIDRTYMRDGDAWKAVDVPGVTGAEADIKALTAHPRGDLYAITTVAVFRWSGSAWQRVSLLDSEGGTINPELMELVPGPAGRFVVTQWGKSDARIGDERGLHATQPLADRLRVSAIDDRGRLWLAGDAGIQVVQAGKVVGFWRATELPFEPNRVVVFAGGPAIGSGERARGKVSGKVEGSAAGITVVACTTGASPGGNSNEPCAGDDTRRQTTTKTGGRFELADVTIAPMKFWVRRGGSWRSTKPVECCAKLSPDGTVDIGVLHLE